MVTRYKVKTRGGKVVSRKKVKSFSSKSKSKPQVDSITRSNFTVQSGITNRSTGEVLQKKGVRRSSGSNRSLVSNLRDLPRSTQSNINNQLLLKANDSKTRQNQTKRNIITLGSRPMDSASVFRFRNSSKLGGSYNNFQSNSANIFPNNSNLGSSKELRQGKPLKDLTWSERADYYATPKYGSSSKIQSRNYWKSLSYSVPTYIKDSVVSAVKSPNTAFNYGKNLRKRFEKGEKAPLLDDVKGLGYKSQVLGTNLGKSVENRDPRLMANLIVSALPIKTKSFDTKLYPSSSKYSVKQNSASGSSKTIIDSKGQTSKGKSYTQQTVLRSNPKSNNVVGQVTTISGKKKSIQKILLQDKGGFYIDKSTGKKVLKNNYTPNNTLVSYAKTTSKQNSPDITRTNNGKFIKTGQRNVTTKKIKTSLSNGKKTTVSKSRSSDLDFATDGRGRIIDSISNRRSSNIKTKRSRSKPVKHLPNKQTQGFVKASGFEPIIIKGLDRRGKLARDLDLRNTLKRLKTKEIKFKNNTILAIKRKSNVKSYGDLPINPYKSYFNVDDMAFKRIGKKGSLSKSKSKSYTKNFEIPNKVSIPKLKSSTKLGKKVKTLRFIPSRFPTRLNTDTVQKLESSKLQPQIKDLKRIQPQTQKNKPFNSPYNKSKTPTKQRKSSPARSTKPVIPARVVFPITPLPKLPKLRSKLSPTNGYNTFVKKKGKWSQLNTQPLKFKKAYSTAKSLVDSTLLSSAKIVGSKIPSNLKSKKFSISSSSRSLLLTERKPFRLDSKNEKAQFKRSKRYLK